ncbi:MAG TPA: LysR family transcriptional regulator [Kofleriaceae bacterium]
MSWDDVRVLLVVLEVRNLHEAARRLGVDRSTVSRKLAGLEQQLGTRLFTRTRDGLRATAAAERMRPFAETMATDAAAVEQAARSVERSATGIVRVATTEAIAVLLVEKDLLSLRDHHPNLQIRISSTNQAVDLLRGEADLAVRISPLRHASLQVRRIARLQIGLFAAPAYLALRGRPTQARLSGHDVIMPGGDLARLPEARWLAARPGIRVAFSSNSVPALVAAAARGVGIVPLTAVLGDLDARLERLQLIEDLPRRGIWIATPATSAMRPAVRVVADRIAMTFARL